ncbi:MAG: hypothetical protein JNG82_09450 [Opitutaceae bacterium]|nr:hypothetical protein [Opitutaceae bacterium]
MDRNVGRPIQVAGMAYAPTCEQGVVCLFGRLAPRLGFTIEQVQVRFPDCIATRRGKSCRIEFEFWASHFAEHRHNPKGADIIVCWENDWESRPARFRHIEIIDLKKYVGALPRIHVVGYRGNANDFDLNYRTKIQWNVPMHTQVDDLVLMYRAGNGHSQIKDLWRVVGPFTLYKKENREGWWPGLHAGLKLVTRLNRPLTYAELAKNPLTRKLAVIRRRFQGKADITEDWPLFYNLIALQNPKAKKLLGEWIAD